MIIWESGVGTSSAGIETLADAVTNQSPSGRFWVCLISGNPGSTMTQISYIRGGNADAAERCG